MENTVPTRIVPEGNSAPASVPANDPHPALQPWDSAIRHPSEGAIASAGPAFPAAPPSPNWQQPSFAQHTNVNVHVGGPTIVLTQPPSGVPLIARVMWYLFIGWWFAPIVMAVGYLLMITILGIPLAFAIFNKLPQALTLRPRSRRVLVTSNGNVTTLSTEHEQQLPLWQRALYFLFVGSWLGPIWIILAYVVGLGIITFPLTLWMLDRIGGVMTLHRH